MSLGSFDVLRWLQRNVNPSVSYRWCMAEKFWLRRIGFDLHLCPTCVYTTYLLQLRECKIHILWLLVVKLCSDWICHTSPAILMPPLWMPTKTVEECVHTHRGKVCLGRTLRIRRQRLCGAHITVTLLVIVSSLNSFILYFVLTTCQSLFQSDLPIDRDLLLPI